MRAVLAAALILSVLTSCTESEPELEFDALLARSLPPGLEPAVEQSIETVRAEVEHHEDPARALGQLARVYHANKLFELAREAYRAAHRADPRDAEWPYLLGAMDLERGHSSDAIVSLRSAVRLDPEYVPGWIRLGRASLDVGDEPGAEAAFLEATRLRPDLPWGHVGLGRTARANGATQDAIDHLERAVGLTPLVPQAVYLLGQAYREAGRSEDAERMLNGFARGIFVPKMEDPRLAALEFLAAGDLASLARAATALRDGDLATAESLYTRVLARRQEDFAATLNLGMVYGLQGRVDDAERQFRRAVALRPDDPAGHFALAQFLLMTDQRALAKRELAAVLRLDPAHPEARRLIEPLGGLN